MNIFDALYINQYRELKKQGKSGSQARTNGTGLMACMIVLNIISILILAAAISPDFLHWLLDALPSPSRGMRSGAKGIGKLLGLGLIGIFFLGLTFTMGSESRFNRLIEKYNAMSADQQKSASNIGLAYVLVSVALVLIAVLTMI